MKENNSLFLSVLVPTFNRGSYLPGIFAFFSQALSRGFISDSEFEIVVSENCSTDDTQVILRDFEGVPYIKIVQPKSHLPTAEENMFFGVSQTSGNYIWVLGDDDCPNIDVFENLLKHLRKDEFDLVITNSSGLSHSGHLFESRTECSDSNQIKSLSDFTQKSGIIFALAGFSTTIMRGEIARKNLEISKKYFSISPIYSHVFWILETFWSHKFSFFPQNLVCYKQNKSDVVENGHWVRAAQNHSAFYRYYWTLGIIRHCKELRSKTEIAFGWFHEVIDQNWFNRNSFLDGILRETMLQLELNTDRSLGTRPMTVEELKEICQFLLAEHASYNIALAPLQIFTRKNLENIDLEEVRRIGKYALQFYEGKFFRRFIITKVNGWYVYKFHKQYFAVCFEPNDARCGILFRDIAPVESEAFLIDTSFEEIIEKCKKATVPRSWLTSEGSNTILSSSILGEEEILFVIKLRKIFQKIKKFIPKKIFRRLH